MEGNILTNLISTIISKLTGYGYNVVNEVPIPVGVSNRHLHLSQADLETLFGSGYQLTVLKDLSQPGQYAAKETLTIVGPKGAIGNVRVLGPVRKQTQVEIMRSDCFSLGVQAPLRESGMLGGSAPITIVGPKGSVYLAEGAIVAKRHIHMTPQDAATYKVSDGQVVSFRTNGERGMVFDNVVCRVSASYALEAHLDMDEANAADIKNGDGVYLITDAFGAKAVASRVPEKTVEASVAEPMPVYNYESLITEDMAKRAAANGTPIYAAADAVFTPLAKDVIYENDLEIIRE